MKKEYKIDKDGRCIVAVNVFTEVGEFCDKKNWAIVKALIDITVPSSIGSRLISQFSLKVKNEIDGKRVSEYTFIGVGLPAIWGKGALGLHPFVFDDNGVQYDMILGCDFLTNLNFERRGKENIFVLSSL